MTKKIVLSIFLLIFISIFSYVYLKKQSNQFIQVNPKRGQIVEAIYGLGTVKSDQTFEVKVGVITTLKEVFVKEGDFVKEGKALVRFEGIGAFTAPFDGTVTNLHYQKGEAVLPQISILKMENLKKLYLEVSLEQDAALRAKKGQMATVIFESIRNEKHLGIVRSIYPKNDEFIARIEVDDFKDNILTGMTADVAIEVGTIDKALLIPVSSIENGKVLVERKNKKIKEDVKIGKMDGAWAEVLSNNLSENDKLFIKR